MHNCRLYHRNKLTECPKRPVVICYIPSPMFTMHILWYICDFNASTDPVHREDCYAMVSSSAMTEAYAPRRSGVHTLRDSAIDIQLNGWRRHTILTGRILYSPSLIILISFCAVICNHTKMILNNCSHAVYNDSVELNRRSPTGLLVVITYAVCRRVRLVELLARDPGITVRAT